MTTEKKRRMQVFRKEGGRCGAFSIINDACPLPSGAVGEFPYQKAVERILIGEEGTAEQATIRQRLEEDYPNREIKITQILGPLAGHGVIEKKGRKYSLPSQNQEDAGLEQETSEKPARKPTGEIGYVRAGGKAAEERSGQSSQASGKGTPEPCIKKTIKKLTTEELLQRLKEMYQSNGGIIKELKKRGIDLPAMKILNLQNDGALASLEMLAEGKGI